jgi:hypothetical protein
MSADNVYTLRDARNKRTDTIEVRGESVDLTNVHGINEVVLDASDLVLDTNDITDDLLVLTIEDTVQE